MIFDSDGTLVDSLKLIVSAYNYAVEPAMHKTFSDTYVSSLFGPTMEKIFTETLPSKYVAEAILRYHQYYLEHFHDHAKVYPEIPELIKSLHGTRSLGVLTGAGRMAATLTLQQSGLADYFQIVVTGDDTHRPKPDPEGLRLTIAKMSAAPQSTVYIGDSRIDIEAAKGAGILSGGALWGSKQPSELAASNPDFLFQKPSEVLKAISYYS